MTDLGIRKIRPRRLIEIQEPYNVQLQDVKDDFNSLYTVLSYCWGTDMPFRNTTVLEAALKLKITHDDLPTIFQEAIRVTYLLGIRYIWADALCIVQDSKDDWECESHKMFAIYCNVYITISALDSVSMQDSMFSRRSITVESESSGALPCAVVVSWFMDYRQLSDLDKGMLARYPLFRRAWNYQERLLSTRILHCAKEEWIFECCTFTNYKYRSK
jgi:hypothetical protein